MDTSADGRRSAAIFATVELPLGGAYRFAASGAIACYLRVFMWLAETRGLKDARQVENLQDQAQVMLGQHTRAQYPNQPVRSAATNTSFLRQFLYRAMLCIRGTSHGPVSVCVRLCLSVCHKSEFY